MSETIWRDSFLGTFLRKAANRLMGIFRVGLWYAILMRIAQGVGSAWQRSLSYRAFSQLARAPSLEQGIIVGVLSRLLHYLSQGLRWLGTKKPFRSSSVMTLLGWLSAHLSVVVCVFAVFVFCTPDSYYNNAYSLVGVLALICLFCAGCIGGTFRTLHLDRLGWALILFFLWIFLSYRSSFIPWLSFRFMLFYATGGLMILLLCSLDLTVEQINRMGTVFSLILLVVAVYGCYQAVIGVEMASGQVDTTVDYTITTRVYSVTNNPIVFAMMLILLIPFSLMQFFSAQKKRHKILHLGSFALGVVAMILTYSRTGYGALLVAVLLFFLITRWRVLPVMGIVSLFALPFLPSTVFSRFLSIFGPKDSSIIFRERIKIVMLPVLRDYWVSGVGLGMDVVRRINAFYNYRLTISVPPHFHDFFMQIWVEAGIIGVILVIAFIVTLFARGLKNRAVTPEQIILKDCVAAGISGIVGLLVAGFADYPWFYPRAQFLFFWIVGLILVASARLEAK
jgi:O-antigen ligase